MGNSGQRENFFASCSVRQRLRDLGVRELRKNWQRVDTDLVYLVDIGLYRFRRGEIEDTMCELMQSLPHRLEQRADNDDNVVTLAPRPKT